MMDLDGVPNYDDPNEVEAHSMWRSGFVQNDEIVQRITYWIGVSTFLILEQLNEIQENQVALSDDINRLQAAVTALQGDVTGITGAVISPDQSAALAQVATDLEAVDASLKALIPA